MKRMLEQNRLEVKLRKFCQEIKKLWRQFSPAGRLGLCRTDHNDRGDRIFRAGLCSKAVEEVVEQLIPGIPEALRAYNLRYSKKAMLDCMAAGIRKNTLIVNLPESAKTAKEDMEYILSEVVQVVEY